MTCPSNSKKTIDMAGQRVGRLTVVRYAGSEKNKAVWECLCDCGNTTVVTGNSLRFGKVKSCGCLKHDKKKDFAYKRDYPRLYGVWAAMKRRCYNSHNAKYHIYGARGIKVCEEWQQFNGFLKWALSSGYDKDAQFMACTIDRIDTNGDYEPKNCRWVDAKTQSNNRRNNRVAEINGVSKTITEWERFNGLNRGTISRRLRRGWSECEAIMTPMHGRRCIQS